VFDLTSLYLNKTVYNTSKRLNEHMT